ncbi:SDR family oxidoreductase [Pelagibacterales bacterium SAG-MED29]|nr:SDR family oxidoreductase [Pelagibacterales bacterium SAG-MED29]
MSKIINKFNLIGKTAIVVGGSGLIGSQTVDTLIDAGCEVINVDLHNNKKKIKNYNFFKVNIQDERNIISFKKKFLKKYKKLNILINHAFYKGNPKKIIPNQKYFSSLDKYPSLEWNKTLSVNLNGMFFLTKHFINLLLKNRNSVILNTSSTYGKVAPNKNIYGNSGINSPIGYATTKSAVIGFTKYLATHYGDKGLRANILVPGGIKSPGQSKKFRKNYEKLTPLKRMANQNDYSAAILYLVSDASLYMTGTEFIIDGGWTSW